MFWTVLILNTSIYSIFDSAYLIFILTVNNVFDRVYGVITAFDRLCFFIYRIYNALNG